MTSWNLLLKWKERIKKRMMKRSKRNKWRMQREKKNEGNKN